MDFPLPTYSYTPVDIMYLVLVYKHSEALFPTVRTVVTQGIIWRRRWLFGVKEVNNM